MCQAILHTTYHMVSYGILLQDRHPHTLISILCKLVYVPVYSLMCMYACTFICGHILIYACTYT